MKIGCLMILYIVILLFAGCGEDEPPAAPDGPAEADTTLSIACPYVTAVTAELEIHYHAGRDVWLYRDDIRIHVFQSLFKDTVFTDQGVTETHSYIYSAVERTPTGGIWKRDSVMVRTLPISRRSLDFQTLAQLSDCWDVRCAPGGRLLLTSSMAPLVVLDGGQFEYPDIVPRGSGLALEYLPDGTIVVITEYDLIYYSGGRVDARPLPQRASRSQIRHAGGDAVVFAGEDGAVYRATSQELALFMKPLHSGGMVYDLSVRDGIVYALIFNKESRSSTLWRSDGRETVPVVTDRLGEDALLRIDDELLSVWVSPSGVIYLGGRWLHRLNGSRVTRITGFPAQLPSSEIYSIQGINDADFMVLGPGPFFYHFDGRAFHGENRSNLEIPPRRTPIRLHLDATQTVMLLPRTPDGPTMGNSPVYLLYARD